MWLCSHWYDACLPHARKKQPTHHTSPNAVPCPPADQRKSGTAPRCAASLAFLPAAAAPGPHLMQRVRQHRRPLPPEVPKSKSFTRISSQCRTWNREGHAERRTGRRMQNSTCKAGSKKHARKLTGIHRYTAREGAGLYRVQARGRNTNHKRENAKSSAKKFNSGKQKCMNV